MAAGSEVWPSEMYEPLTIGLVFPFLSVRPWQIRGTPKMLNLGRTMSGLLKDSNLVTGNLLRKLCKQMWKLRSMPENVVWRVLYFASDDVSRCGNFAPCQRMWCGECYTSHPTMQADVEASLHAIECGAESVILRIRRFCSM
jgi:hypothetical protein